jgi:hypothetical protein
MSLVLAASLAAHQLHAQEDLKVSFTANPVAGTHFVDTVKEVSGPGGKVGTQGLRYKVISQATSYPTYGGKAGSLVDNGHGGKEFVPAVITDAAIGTVYLTGTPADSGATEWREKNYNTENLFKDITVPVKVTVCWVDTLERNPVKIDTFLCTYYVVEIEENAFKAASNGNTVLQKITFEEETVDQVTANFRIRKIGNSAFESASNLSAVPWSDLKVLNVIGDNAFAGTALTGDLTLTLPALQKIGTSAFASIGGLTGVTLETSVLQEIGEKAFDANTLMTVDLKGCPALKPELITKTIFGNSIKTLTLPEVYTGSIVEGAFKDLGNLQTVNFPHRVVKIGKEAFANCTNLKTLTWPTGGTTNTVDTVGEAAFKGTQLAHLDFTTTNFFPSIRVIEPHAFSGVTGDATTGLKLVNTLDSIGVGAFDAVQIANFSHFNTEPGTLIKDDINSLIFKVGGVRGGTSRLQNITLPTFLTVIDSYAFYNCPTLTTVNWSELTGKLKEIKSYAFAHTGVGTGTNFNSDLKGLDNLLVIGDSAFSNAQIKTPDVALTLPNDLEYIGTGAFDNNSSLTKVNLTANGRLHLTSVPPLLGEDGTLYDRVHLIQGTFGKWLKELAFPTLMPEIEADAFANGSLQKITWPEANFTIGKNAFKNGLAPDFQIGTDGDAKTLTLPVNCTAVGEAAFAENTGLTTLALALANHLSLSSINKENFGEHLTTVTYPTNPVTLAPIPPSAFEDLSTLTTVTLPENPKITAIGDSAFAGTGIPTIAFDKLTNVTAIGKKAFYNIPCASTSLDFNNRLTALQTIGDSAFIFRNGLLTEVTLSGLSQLTTPITKKIFGDKLTSINLPTHITAIADSAFANCAALTTVNFADLAALTTIGDSAFAGTKIGNGTLNLSLNVNLSTTGNRAFRNAGITSLTLGAGITSIGIQPVENNAIETLDLRLCTKLNPSEIRSSNFGKALKKITFPPNLANIDETAFVDCASLKEVNWEDLTQLTSIGSEAFSNTIVGTDDNFYTYFPSIGSAAGGLTIWDAFKNVGITTNGTNKKLKLPTKLIKLGVGAFTGNPNLKHFDLADNTETALLNYFKAELAKATSPAYAKWFGNEIVDFTYPKNQDFTGVNAWNGYGKLEKLTLPADATSLTIDNASFKNAFAPNSQAIQPLNIPAKTFSIGNEAFANNPQLTELIFENDQETQASALTSIGAAAFQGTGITTITAGTYWASLKNVTSIGAAAFQGLPLTANPHTTLNLTGMTALTTIGEGAFIFAGSLPTRVRLDANTLLTTPVTQKIFGTYLKDLWLPTNTETIAEDAFSSCSSLNFLNWPALTLLKSIGKNAFANSPAGLTTGLLDLSKSSLLTSIGEGAFKNTDLTSVTLPKLITSIGNQAFADNGKLTTVDLSACTQLADDASSQTVWGKKLTTFFFPLHIENIPADAFNGLTKLATTNLTSPPTTPPDVIPAQAGTCQLTHVGPRAFLNTAISGDLDLSSLTAPTALGAAAFAGTKLRAVSLPDALTALPDSVFAGVSSLKWIFRKGSSQTHVLAFGTPAADEAGTAVAQWAGLATEWTTDKLSTAPPADGLRSLLSIGKAACYGTALSGNFVWPEFLTAIGDSAFANNPAITPSPGPSFSFSLPKDSTITPASLRSIGAAAFRNALPNLKRLEFKGNITLGDYAFAGAKDLAVVRNVLGTTTFSGPAGLSSNFPTVSEGADARTYYFNYKDANTYSNTVTAWKTINWTATPAYKTIIIDRSDKEAYRVKYNLGEIPDTFSRTIPIEFRYGINFDEDVYIRAGVWDVEQNEKVKQDLSFGDYAFCTGQHTEHKAPVELEKHLYESATYLIPYTESGLDEARSGRMPVLQQTTDLTIGDNVSIGITDGRYLYLDHGIYDFEGALAEPCTFKVTVYTPEIQFFYGENLEAFPEAPLSLKKGDVVRLSAKLYSGDQPVKVPSPKDWSYDIWNHISQWSSNEDPVLKITPKDGYYDTGEDRDGGYVWPLELLVDAYPTADYTLPSIPFTLSHYWGCNKTVANSKTLTFAEGNQVLAPKAVAFSDLAITPSTIYLGGSPSTTDLSFKLTFDGTTPNPDDKIYDSSDDVTKTIAQSLSLIYSHFTSALISDDYSKSEGSIKTTLTPTNQVGVSNITAKFDPPGTALDKEGISLLPGSLTILLDNSPKTTFDVDGWHFEIIEEAKIHTEDDNNVWGKVALVQKDITGPSAYPNLTGTVSNIPPTVSYTMTPPGAGTPVALNYRVTALGIMALRDCDKLTGIVLPQYIDSIARYAFYGCSALTSVNWSDLPNLRTIGEFAFTSTPLTSTLVIPAQAGTSSLTYIGNSAFQKTKLTAIDLRFADGASLGTDAFAQTDALTTARLSGASPTNTLLIKEPFRASALQSLTLQNADLSLQPFRALPSLTTVSFDGKGTVPKDAFSACTALQTISFLPNSEYTLDEGAFQGVSGLQYLAWPVIPTLNTTSPENKIEKVFVGIPEDCKIYLPWARLSQDDPALQTSLASWGRDLEPTYSLRIVEPGSRRLELYSGRADTLRYQILRYGQPLTHETHFVDQTDLATYENTFKLISIRPLKTGSPHGLATDSKAISDGSLGGGHGGLGLFRTVSHYDYTGLDTFVVSLNGDHLAGSEDIRPDTFFFAVKSPMTQIFDISGSADLHFNGKDTLRLFAGEKNITIKSFISLYGEDPLEASPSVKTHWDTLRYSTQQQTFTFSSLGSGSNQWRFAALLQDTLSFAIKATINDAVDSTRLTVIILPVDTLVIGELKELHNNSLSTTIATRGSVDITANVVEYAGYGCGDTLLRRPFTPDTLLWRYKTDFFDAQILETNGVREANKLRLIPKIYSSKDSTTGVSLRYFAPGHTPPDTFPILLKKPDIRLETAFSPNYTPPLEQVTNGDDIHYQLESYNKRGLNAEVYFDGELITGDLIYKVPELVKDHQGVDWINWRIHTNKSKPVIQLVSRGRFMIFQGIAEGTADISFSLSDEWIEGSSLVYSKPLYFDVPEVSRSLKLFHNGNELSLDEDDPPFTLAPNVSVTLQVRAFEGESDEPNDALLPQVQWLPSPYVEITSTDPLRGTVTFKGKPVIQASSAPQGADASLEAQLLVDGATAASNVLPLCVEAPPIKLVVSHSGATAPIFSTTLSGGDPIFGEAPTQTLLAYKPYTFSVRIFAAEKELPIDSLRVTWEADNTLLDCAAADGHLVRQHQAIVKPVPLYYATTHQTTLTLSVAGITCNVPVTIPAADGLDLILDNAAASVPLRRTQADAITVTPKLNGFPVPPTLLPTLYWSTDDEDVVKTSTGSNITSCTIEGLASGETRVYVGQHKGDKEGPSFIVTVTPPAAKLFIGAPNAADSVKSVAIGQYFPRTTSLLIDGQQLDSAAVSWTLSPPQLFTVTPDNEVQGRTASFTPRSLDSVDIRAVAIVEGQTITSTNKLRLRVTKPDITFDPIPAAGQTFRRDGNTVYDTFQVAQSPALLSVSINLNGAPAAPILPQLQWTSFDTTAIRLTPLPSRLGLPDTTFLTVFKSPIADTIILSARVKGTRDSLRFRLTVLPPALSVTLTAPPSSSAASKSLQLEDTLALRVTSSYGSRILPPSTPTGSSALGSGSSGSGAFPASAVLTYTWSSPAAGVDTIALLPIAGRSDSLRLTATYAPADSIPLVIRSSAGSLDTFRIKVVPPTLSILPPLPAGQTLSSLPPASASLFSFTATTTPLPGSTQPPRPLSPPLRTKALWTSPNLHKLFIVATDEAITPPAGYAPGDALVTTRDTGFTSLSLSLAGASLSRPVYIPLPASLSLTLAADTDLLQRPTPASPLASLQLLPTLLLNSDTLRLETLPDPALSDTFRITWLSLDTVLQTPVAVSPLGLATASAARLTREDTVRIVARIAAFGRSASDTFALRLRRQTATSLLPLPLGVSYSIRLTPSGLHLTNFPPATPILVYTIEGKQIFKASPEGSTSGSSIFLPHPFLPHRLYLIHTPQATFKLMTDED